LEISHKENSNRVVCRRKHYKREGEDPRQKETIQRMQTSQQKGKYIMQRKVSKTSIRKTPYEQEWQVRAYDKDGIRMPNADYFTDSFEDAFATAKSMVKKEEKKEMAESAYPYVAYNSNVANTPFYLAFSTRNSSFSVFLTEEDFLELQIKMELAKKVRYESLTDAEKELAHE
jgi:hypothetical protein